MYNLDYFFLWSIWTKSPELEIIPLANQMSQICTCDSSLNPRVLKKFLALVLHENTLYEVASSGFVTQSEILT